jgi:hypothetical protein
LGYRAHRRQLRSAEAETELLPTERWMPVLDQMPTEARVAVSKPAESKPGTWFDTYLNAVALISSGVVIAVVILLVGLAT